MAGIGGAGYNVWVEFGLKNRMTQGVRSVQAQMRGIQAQVNATGKQTAEHLKRIQKQAAVYGSVFGNPKSYEEAKKNLNTIYRQKARLQNQLLVTEAGANRQVLEDRYKALQMTERDVRAKMQGFQVSVAQGRSQMRMAQAAERERKAEERALRRRQQMYRGIGSGAFRTAEYAGVGAAGVGFGLFEAWKAAAQQQQLATTTAMVLGYKGGAQAMAANELFKSQLKNSMAVGLLSSADIAAVQTQLAMHVPGLGMKNLLGLTPLVAKFADVMKMTKIPGAEDPAQSAAVAAMIANVFNARNPASMRKILEQFFVMEQSTGADVSTSVNAISQYGALGKALGFTPQDMIDLYGAMFRMGAGKGKVGARLGTLLTRIGTIPTSVMRAWGSSALGLVDHSGIPNILKQAGGPTFDAYLRLLSNEYQASVHKWGPAAGKARFLTAMSSAYGLTAEKVLFPLIQSGSIQNYEAQIKRHQQFATIEQAQATFFNLPINQWKRAMTNFQTLIIAFGNADPKSLGNFFKYWANTFEKWTEWLQGHQAKTKAAFDTLANIVEVLASIAGASALVGVIARVTEGFFSLKAGIGVFQLAMADGRLAFLGPLGLVAAVGLTAWYFRDPLMTALKGFLHWLQSLPVIGKFFGSPNHPLKNIDPKTHWNKKSIEALKHATGIGPVTPHHRTLFDTITNWWNWMHSDSIPGAPPRSQHAEIHVHNIHIDGKKVATAVTRHQNRATRHGIHSTTPGQSTAWIPSFETLGGAMYPNLT